MEICNPPTESLYSMSTSKANHVCKEANPVREEFTEVFNKERFCPWQWRWAKIDIKYDHNLVKANLLSIDYGGIKLKEILTISWNVHLLKKKKK